MGAWDKTKYQVMVRPKDGEPITCKRTWLSKDNALESAKNMLDTGHFAWATLIVLDINGALKGVEEYFTTI